MILAQANTGRLEDLHGIVVPAGVPWWPPAPGWYVLAVVLVVAAILLLIGAWRRRQVLSYRRAALAEMKQLRIQLAISGSECECARKAAVLLKRTAMHVYSRPRVASLSGEPWLAFLDEHGGRNGFRTEAGIALLDATYGKPANFDAGRVENLLDCVDRWIRSQGAPERDEAGGAA